MYPGEIALEQTREAFKESTTDKEALVGYLLCKHNQGLGTIVEYDREEDEYILEKQVHTDVFYEEKRWIPRDAVRRKLMLTLHDHNGWFVEK